MPTDMQQMIGRALSITAMAIFLSTFSACARYAPQPLSREVVEGALVQPSTTQLSIAAAALHHPLLPPCTLDFSRGITPDEAAVIAVLIRPSLRASRDQQQVSDAQVLSAGILPNPQLSYNTDFVTGGNTAGTFTGYGLGLTWEVTSLVTREAKVAAARHGNFSVHLDIAWQEWQVAEAAKLAAFDLISLHQQRIVAMAIDHQLADNLQLIRRAADNHDRTLIDVTAADIASREAHAAVLALDQQVNHQRLQLLNAMGLATDSTLQLQDDAPLPDAMDFLPPSDLLANLETRRLDLVALRQGYQSEEETLRATILAQFPKISLGFNPASDTSNVHTIGLGVTVDLPIFDRNQGGIALETATRQKLSDEYVSRVFEARSNLAMALAGIRALADQINDARASLPALEELVRTYRAAYENRSIDALTYFLAVTDLDHKRLALQTLQQQWLQNRVALELAAGVYLPAATTKAGTQPATSPATEPNP